jgi:hypothetical protein
MFTSGNGARNDVSRIAMVITDGSSNDPKETLKNAREVGIHCLQLDQISLSSFVTLYFSVEQCRRVNAYYSSIVSETVYNLLITKLVNFYEHLELPNPRKPLNTSCHKLFIHSCILPENDPMLERTYENTTSAG